MNNKGMAIALALTGGVILTEVYAAASNRPIVEKIPESQAYCRQTGPVSLEIVDNQFPDQPILKLEKGFSDGRTVSGYALSPDGKGGRPVWHTLGEETCTVEAWPNLKYQYTLK